MVAARLASSAGWCTEVGETSVPTRTRVVTAAMAGSTPHTSATSPRAGVSSPVLGM